ncbi:hypothetical protein [Glutamicibacter protophormiae]|uniref:Uncharacterized protein n=1 Tax=Glutamicibacter protophormiae TaxID=37930 RepID=A0ABS4XLC0_GLUPR|nr:hypothetical protein [Glutamicibacter protophormiae]MBP2397294.1 hypothetical protein [Glutamicibacter protophormiae]GGL80325.1 hypothetical protein GCM10010038_07980 [Glutamicibacter protophormiae]
MQVQELLSLSDIARLAQVQRPVVTVWRSRSRGTETPFPEPARTVGSQDFFDAAEIVSWFKATGRGNNPEFDADAAAFSNIARDNFHSVSALLVLRQLWDRPFKGLGSEDLLDAADGIDPDDEFLYSELEAASDHLEFLAAYVDKLVDASYGALPALQSLVSDRFRATETAISRTAISAQARQLVARCALELSGVEMYFHEATHAGSDLIHELARSLDESAAAVIQQPAVTGSPSPEVRMALRRLKMLASANESLSLVKTRPGNQQVVHVAQFPSPGMPTTDPETILHEIDDLVLELGPAQGAVVIAPADVLIDAMPSKKSASIRGSILRMGRVRAAARLPQGHLLYKPRTAMALWVIGPEAKGLPLAERRIMLSNLSDLELDEQVIDDFATDIGASLIGDDALRSHAFRFAQWARASVVVASTGSLIPGKRNTNASAAVDSSSLAKRQVQLELALDHLNSSAKDRPELKIELRPRNIDELPSRDHRKGATPLGDLVSQGTIRLISGTRFTSQALDSVPSEGIKVWNAADLREGLPTSVVSYFDLAQAYDQAVLTKAGDVVFTAHGKPTAVVDHQGSHAVNYPVRILRIDSQESSGIMAEVLVKDINDAQHSNWRRWDIRRLPQDMVAPLESSLRIIEEERLAAAQRIGQLDIISEQLISTLLSGEAEIINPSICTEGRP